MGRDRDDDRGVGAVTASAPGPSGLKQRWLAAGVLGLLALLAAGWALQRFGWAPARWPWLAVPVWAGLMLWSGLGLELHRTEPGGPLLDRLGPGNWMTIGRAAMLSALAGYLLAPRLDGLGAWLPAMLYTGGDVIDYFDGYLARRSNTSSPFGERFDLELDAAGLLLAVLVAVRYGSLPLWFLPLGFARYLFAGLIWLRRRRDLPLKPLSDSLARRPLAGLTMGYLSVVLWPILDPTSITLAGIAFGIPFSLGFVRDGLVVSGVWDPDGQAYRRWRRVLRNLLLGWAPIPLRLAVLLYAALELPTYLQPSERLLAGWGRIGLEGGFSLAAAFSAVVLLGVAAIVIGVAGRFAAFALLFPLGLTAAAVGTDPVRAVGLLAAVGILMAGTGRLSIWQPSDQLFRRRAGEAAE